jgi:hypothetical protein
MGRQNWFGTVGDEHRHVREAVGIFDQSSFAKYEMTGKDAQKALDWICANDVSKPVGRLTYTQLLNTRGGIEADLTVARLADDKFYIVTGTGFRTHDLGWIRTTFPMVSTRKLRRCDRGFRHAVADGAEGARRCWKRSPMPTSPTRPSPSAMCGKSCSPAMTCGRCASPMSASSAGSCMCRSAPPAGVRRADGGRCKPSASARSATARWNRCAWKRAIAPGDPTSRPTTPPSRPVSAGR